MQVRARTSKCFHLALIVLLNVGGGPMSWAHGAMGALSVPAAGVGSETAAGHCPAQGAQTESPTEPAPVDQDELPCCADRACHCGCPPSLPLISPMPALPLERTFPPAELPPAPLFSVPPGHPFRPPIA